MLQSNLNVNTAPAPQKFNGTPTFFWEVNSGLFAFDKLLETAISVSKEKNLELVVLGINEQMNDLPKAIENTERLIKEAAEKLQEYGVLKSKLAEASKRHSITDLSFTPKMIADFEKNKGDELARNIELTNLQIHLQSKSKKHVRLSIEVVERLIVDYAKISSINELQLQKFKEQKTKELAFFNTLTASEIKYKFISGLNDNLDLSNSQKLVVAANISIDEFSKYCIGKPLDLLAYKLHGAEESTTDKSDSAMRYDLSKISTTSFGKIFSLSVTEAQACGYETTKTTPKPIADINYYLNSKFQVREFNSKRDDAIVPFNGGGDVIPAGKGTVGLTTTLLSKHEVSYHEALINGAKQLVIRNINTPAVQEKVAKVSKDIYSGQPSMFSGMFGI